MPVDYKKTEKSLYQPKTVPSVIDVPEMIFITVEGKGNPNTSAEYKSALEALYGLSYSIKMSKINADTKPNGYFEYVVPPLEGLWWAENEEVDFSNKDAFCWISMIRQPEFVTEEVFETNKATLAKKKPEIDLSKAKIIKFAEGLCVQVMHIGSYDNEPATIAGMERFTNENGYTFDINTHRRHHEIYLSDPRKIETSKLKTIIRYPIKKS